METLNVEYLQKLTYDRSQSWSSFFEVFENDEAIARLEDINEDIDISDVDKGVSRPEKYVDSDDDDLASMEDDDYIENVSSEFLQNASTHSQFSIINGNTTMDLLAVTRNDEKQYVDVINKTLPIFNEHNRQLKEYGFDKVLISFKRDKIDNEFGTWLNRHNSLFVNNCSSMSKYCNPKKSSFGTSKELTPYVKGKSGYTKNKELCSDSDASLQSGETARYIRSSRKGTTKNSMTTLIKTYRMVSTRKALREKYACETDTDYYGNILRLNKNYNNKMSFGRSDKMERPPLSARTNRRKVYRKRLQSNNGDASYSSSSDSEYSENRHNSGYRKLKCSANKYQRSSETYYHAQVTAINKDRNRLKTKFNFKLSSAMRNRFLYFSRSHSMSVSSSSPSSSYNSTFEKRLAIKRNAKCSTDDRPCKQESECLCCNDNDLCKKFKHVAHSATADWFVEDGCSPNKTFKTPQNKTQTKTQNSKSSLSKMMTTNKLQPNEKCKSKAKNNKKDLRENKNEIEQRTPLTGDSSDAEFQLAIKASRESYDKEQKKKLDKPKKNLKTLEKTIEESLLSGETTINKNVCRKTDKVIKKAKSKGTKRPNEETFFTPKSQKIYNSTALSCDGDAFKRQFTEKRQQQQDEVDTVDDDITIIELKNPTKVEQKSAKKKFTSTRIYTEKAHDNETDATGSAVISTTIRSPELHLIAAASPQTENNHKKQIDELNCDDQSDCAHVTSTTHLDTTVGRNASDIELAKSPCNRVSNSNHQSLTQKCILIYDPNNRNVAVDYNISNDGFFTVTNDHLNAAIGEKAATKFFKYYIGSKRFKLDSKVYYRPPNNALRLHNLSSSSSSSGSADDLDNVGLYGDLFAVNI